MHKISRALCMLLLLSFAVLVAGCNEEEKYNTAKNELLQIQEECKESDKKLLTGEAPIFAIDQSVIQKHEEYVKQMDEKIAEMEKYATAKTEMNNDFLVIKKHHEMKKSWWQAEIKQAEDRVKLWGKDGGGLAPAIDNPYEKYR